MCKDRGLGRPGLETHPVEAGSEARGLCLEKHLRLPHKQSPVNKCVSYFTVHTNINADSGSVNLENGPGAAVAATGM